MLRRLYGRGEAAAQAAASRIGGALRHAECRPQMRMALFFLLLLLIGGVMFLLNSHTPLMMDDFDYSFSWATGERIGGIGDVMDSQAAHYRLWGGRSVVHAIAQLFLSADKAVFNAANTVMYLLLLLEIYALARPRGKRFCWPLLLIAHAALFCCVPFFGTVFLWLTGACNYLWGTALALLPLLVMRSVEEDGFFARGRNGWLALPVCFFAGWTNENTACGVLALMGVWLVGRWIMEKRVAAWQAAALLAQALGVAVMLLAPGNFGRASSYDTGNLVVELIRRAVMATAYGGVYVGGLLVAALLLWSLAGALGVRRRGGYALLLLFGGFCAAYAMVASPVFSDRSWTGVFVLVLIAVLALLGDIDEQVHALDAAKLLALPLALLLVAYGGYKALSDVKAHEAAWQAQVQAIELAAKQGEPSVDVQGVQSHSRFTMDISIAQDAGLWPNSTLSKAFGISVNGM